MASDVWRIRAGILSARSTSRGAWRVCLQLESVDHTPESSDFKIQFSTRLEGRAQVVGGMAIQLTDLMNIPSKLVNSTGLLLGCRGDRQAHLIDLDDA
ncbi:hypothetical protein D3C78_1775260 [compost metagenome]